VFLRMARTLSSPTPGAQTLQEIQQVPRPSGRGQLHGTVPGVGMGRGLEDSLDTPLGGEWPTVTVGSCHLKW
jgi:hypothetical protein